MSTKTNRNRTRTLIATLALGSALATTATASASTASTLASNIAANPRITLATVHASGVVDRANARQNIRDVAAGKQARRSSYGTAPGGTTPLDTRVLSTLVTIAPKHKISVSEIAGGSHSAGSRHYLGRAFDINYVDGTHVTSSHKGAADVVRICKAKGSTYALIESGNHVHCQW